ncbi:hypothetical protein E1B28_011587 [Marasmius oreades]|uniref:DUF1996 domain-containing protein n=1 Tax=Marasmius oreades TaxID=181124 RepID=A0A9P7RV19_9AGAR|nr:uncharacterized protein E1B28_011587 [Marasmius oreades]KAG7089962.1 hypothetical protein E1B28_011587 [Marasmius oreades]
MCWDGKNVDSPDHKSHVAFPSGGPDTGGCSDPKFPVTLPRVFMEMYWGTADFKDHVQDAMNPEQPFVFANGDPTGYGYHGDYINGWKPDVLQRVVDECDCDPNGSLDCCAAKGIFTLDKDSKCRITKAIDEATQGTLPKLPGNNPIQAEGTRATSFPDTTNPNLLSPIYVYRGDTPDKVGTPSGSAASGGGTGVSSGSGSESGQSGSSGSDQTPPPTGGEQNGNSDQPPTSGTGSASSDGGQSLPTTLTSSAASPPPTSGSNNDNTGSGSNGNNQSNQSGQSLPVSPPTGSGSSGSSSGGTSNSSSQQGSTGGSGSKTCKSGVKKRSSKAKRHGNSVRRRFHASDF